MGIGAILYGMTGTDAKTDLHRYLKVAREALLWKLEGLSEYEARRPMVPTGTNLLGLGQIFRVEAFMNSLVTLNNFAQAVQRQSEGEAAALAELVSNTFAQPHEKGHTPVRELIHADLAAFRHVP